MSDAVQIPGIFCGRTAYRSDFRFPAAFINSCRKSRFPVIMIHRPQHKPSLRVFLMQYRELIGHTGIRDRIFHKLSPFVIIKGCAEKP